MRATCLLHVILLELTVLTHSADTYKRSFQLTYWVAFSCILVHFGLITGVIDELYPTPDPHTAPDCKEIPSTVYASDLYSRGAWFESRL